MLLRWASSGFRPNKISGLVAWYRFGQGITVSTGVSQWDDASGNGNHLKQATGSFQPAKQADGSILFDGSDDYLKTSAFTLNQPTTVYLLFKPVSWTNGDRVWDGDSADSMRFAQLAGAANDHWIRAGGASDIGPVNLPTGSYYVVAAVYNGASSSVQNGTATPVTGDVGSSNPGGFTLGAGGSGSNNSNVQVKELAVFAAAHDAATRARMVAYFNAVGGL